MKKLNRLCAKAGVLVGALVIASGSGLTQEMVLPTHEVPTPDVAAEVLRSDQSRIGWVKLGPFDIIPGFESSVYFDDNVGAQEVNEEEAIVLTLAPTIEMLASDMEQRMGKRLRLKYTPGFLFFFGDEVSDRNQINHSADISGDLAGAKLSVGFLQRVRFTTGPVIDLGTSADRMAYSTRLTSEYFATEKTSIEVNGGLSVVDYSDEIYTDSYDLSNDNWLNYQYSPKLRLGLGLVIGYRGIKDQPDQTYQQLQARAGYSIAEKVEISASAGGEWRQYKSGIDDSINPVWNATIAYQPRDSTFLQLLLFQRYQTSAASVSQSYVYTGVTLSLRQMLMQRMALNLSGTYSFSDYEGTSDTVDTTRQDDLYLVRISFDYYIKPNWTAGLFYDYQTRVSTFEDLEFERNRIGLQTAWDY